MIWLFKVCLNIIIAETPQAGQNIIALHPKAIDIAPATEVHNVERRQVLLAVKLAPKTLVLDHTAAGIFSGKNGIIQKEIVIVVM